MNKELWWENANSKELKRYRMKIYNSKRWIATRFFVLSDNPFCVLCAEEDKVVAAVDVDHIQPLSDILLSGLNPELAYDLDNLRGLCKKCHGEKSATEGLVKYNKNKKLKPFKPK